MLREIKIKLYSLPKNSKMCLMALTLNRSSTFIYLQDETKILKCSYSCTAVAGVAVSKADFSYVVPILKAQFPDHAIVNIDYRLATMQSPAFPKQIQDIEKVINHLKESDYSISSDYAFIGASAGAHLSMLYSYRYDKAGDVKAVCNIVGPADFTDPFYAHHPYYHFAGMYLIGDMTKHPEAAIEVSPALQITKDAPPTIMFYGGKDPVVPVSQAERLKQKLDAAGVDNEYHLYANGSHGGWNDATMKDFQDKLVSFVKKHF
jgi:acetyl esterase/lipase